MFGDDVVVRTRLIPPRLPRRWLRRPRLDDVLAGAAEHAVTVVCASTGYGKSSMLASFAARGGWPTVWYSLDEGADDPLVFLLHLVHAFRSIVGEAGARTIALLEASRRGAQTWSQALDALINDLVLALDDETLLILDDYHVVDDLPDIRALIERLIVQRPPLLHMVLATRRWPELTCIPMLQVRGELLEVTEADLAFTEAEIAMLFASAHGQTLSAEEALAMSQQTGGWAIALQLISQSARDAPGLLGAQRSKEKVPATLPGSILSEPKDLGQELPADARDVLFAYLAQDVLARQPEDVQSFLLRSSVLAELDPVACDRVLSNTTSAATLRALDRRGLFLMKLGTDLYRYHPLFHAFLQQHAQAVLSDWADLHRRAAAYYRDMGVGEKVLEHLMAVGDINGAVTELERWAQPWLDSGRFVTLLAWLDQLPAEVFTAHPQLLLVRGDAARLLDRFGLALQAYAEAERIYAARAEVIGQARALQGRALVYLDTVRPALATDLLKQAFKLLPREQQEARAALLRLIAENRLNQGRADQAARLYRVADRLGQSTPGSTSDSQPRLLLRMGRLSEAQALLEREVPHDRRAVAQRRPEAHREVTMLLALVCALQGDGDAALQYAQQGLDAARHLGSALFEAIAHIRLGHALQLVATPDQLAAHQHYLQAMALANAFNVQRTKAEAYMGLVLLHGFGGDLPAAQAAAWEGLAIVERSGDAWMAALLWTALGAVGVVNRAEEAATWLQEALNRYQVSKDTYGQAVVQLWLSVWHHRAGRHEIAAQHAHATLALAVQYQYVGLLTRPTLFGPRDRMLLVPILLAACADRRWRKQAQACLAQSFPAIAADDATQTYHPGSTLRIQTFGLLRVWRGTEEVAPHEWQRKKASQLLALLITNRHRWLLREQICDWLWPEEMTPDAEAHFKVTLNALNVALEPARPPRIPPFYIRRQGAAYRFSPPDGVWLDVEEFEMRIAAAKRLLDAGTDNDLLLAQAELTVAVGLYQDDYLSDCLYEEWARDERERLAVCYLEAATLLAELFIRRNQLPEAIQACDAILARDPCWEDAYRLLMRAYARQGNRRQVLATYERCVRNLRAHLDVAPLPQTTQLYEKVKASYVLRAP